MKKIYPPLVILAIGIFLSVFVVTLPGSNSIVGNEEALREIEKFSSAPYNEILYDNLDTEDFDNIVELTKDDAIARSLVKEAAWLAQHNEPQHVGHALYYLSEYIKTGVDEICIPHELTHIKIYLEHESFDFAEAQTRVAEKYKSEWLVRSGKSYEKYPQFYPNYNEMLSSIDDVLVRLGNKQYDNETMKLLEFIAENSVC